MPMPNPAPHRDAAIQRELRSAAAALLLRHAGAAGRRHHHGQLWPGAAPRRSNGTAALQLLRAGRRVLVAVARARPLLLLLLLLRCKRRLGGHPSHRWGLLVGAGRCRGGEEGAVRTEAEPAAAHCGEGRQEEGVGGKGERGQGQSKLLSKGNWSDSKAREASVAKRRRRPTQPSEASQLCSHCRLGLYSQAPPARTWRGHLRVLGREELVAVVAARQVCGTGSRAAGRAQQAEDPSKSNLHGETRRR